MSRHPSIRPRTLAQLPRHIKERDPFKIERRRSLREPAEGVLAASYRGEGRFGITHLQLLDRSDRGLGAHSDVRIDPGMTVTICPEGSTLPWVSATAVRCQPDAEGGYTVGLQYSGCAAAA